MDNFFVYQHEEKKKRSATASAGDTIANAASSQTNVHVMQRHLLKTKKGDSCWKFRLFMPFVYILLVVFFESVRSDVF